MLNVLNLLIGMFMHVYISHSKRAITISFLYNINLKNCKIKGYQYILQNVSNDTILKKKKKNYTHQKISNCTIFSNFLGGACPKPPEQRVWLHYHVAMCSVLL